MIGAGRWQLPLIRAVRSRGLRCVATDRDPEAPGADLADAFHPVGMEDGEGLLEIARLERVRAAVSDQTDRAVPVVARLNAALGAPGLGLDVAERFTDKLAMRRSLATSSVSMPVWAPVASSEDAVSAARHLGGRVVIKPRDNQASVGVSLVDGGQEEVHRAFFRARSATGCDSVLVEEYVDGLEVTADGVCIGGQVSVLAVSEKRHYPSRPCVARSLAWPPRLASGSRSGIESATVAAVQSMGLRDGLFHAEFRVRDDTPHLIEIAARGGGSGIASTIVPHVSGVDPVTVLVELALGGRPSLVRRREQAAVLGFFDVPAGRVTRVLGVEAARAEGLADVLELTVAPGDVLGAPDTDRDRVGRFIILDSDRDAADRRALELLQRVRVEVEHVA